MRWQVLQSVDVAQRDIIIGNGNNFIITLSLVSHIHHTNYS